MEFDYSAQEVDELTIHKGDVITDIRMQPGGWWEGCLHGRRGMFPDNFVKVRSYDCRNVIHFHLIWNTVMNTVVSACMSGERFSNLNLVI